MKDKLIIAIDGQSGCGKSSTAKSVAAKLNYTYIDTGAMYRAVTLYVLQHNIDYSDLNQLQKALQNISLSFHFDPVRCKQEIYLNGLSVENKIRNLDVSNKVSEISAISEVRRQMVDQQRQMGKEKGIVMDGRDIGTVVFPNADIKIFMSADLKIRAQRRLQELNEKGIEANFDEIVSNLKERDRIDSERADSPLRKAEDAFDVDTTNISFEEQVDKILELIESNKVA